MVNKWGFMFETHIKTTPRPSPSPSPYRTRYEKCVVAQNPQIESCLCERGKGAVTENVPWWREVSFGCRSHPEKLRNAWSLVLQAACGHIPFLLSTGGAPLCSALCCFRHLGYTVANGKDPLLHKVRQRTFKRVCPRGDRFGQK